MKRLNFAPGALSAPLPPCMVTVGDMEKNNVLTVAWTGILATVPPKTYISVRPTRYSYTMLGVGKEFVINLPSASLAKEVDFVGIYTGAKMDKFEKCSLTRIKSEKVEPPTIAECPIALECRVCEVLKMGSHDVFIADILSVSCNEAVVDEEGKMRFEKADLLAYAHGEYYTLGEIVGKFGFSTDKGKKTQAKSSAPKKTEAKKEFAPKKQEKNIKTKPKKAEEREPFYKNAPKGKNQKKKPPSDKGKPHGKRIKGDLK